MIVSQKFMRSVPAIQYTTHRHADREFASNSGSIANFKNELSNIKRLYLCRGGGVMSVIRKDCELTISLRIYISSKIKYHTHTTSSVVPNDYGKGRVNF